MAYTLPDFNLTCDIWWAFFTKAATAPFTPPGGAPDVAASPCQLYTNSRGVAEAQPFVISAGKLFPFPYYWNQFHIRLPALTDVRQYMWSNVPADQADVIECPQGSGVFYVVMQVWDAHKGFANEYRVATSVQVLWPIPIP